ncbi:hypothetical protein IE077_003004 [Cardiosporidium cionae]|uniref:Secreted protein n=1 Tax=Cardiosporidium cionae TaxID=476202 RepID=A0ABQ7J9C5_9APIC|nr:hypothetical protein IE077_003004 [Cardiosporidium cionae]|eukprot:KAF8820601.1 hypothetical protein IE077_003004 [Cardiosporidium cionae]
MTPPFNRHVSIFRVWLNITLGYFAFCWSCDQALSLLSLSASSDQARLTPLAAHFGRQWFRNEFTEKTQERQGIIPKFFVTLGSTSSVIISRRNPLDGAHVPHARAVQNCNGAISQNRGGCSRRAFLFTTRTPWLPFLNAPGECTSCDHTILCAVPKKKTSRAKTRSRRANWFRRQPNKHVKKSAIDLVEATKKAFGTLTAACTTRAGWLELPPTSRQTEGHPLLRETKYTMKEDAKGI